MTFEDRADEVVAALEALGHRPEVDPRQRWLFGGSQGGGSRRSQPPDATMWLAAVFARETEPTL